MLADVEILGDRNVIKKAQEILKYRVRQWIGRFGNTVFFWFGNTGADAVIAILLPTLKRFSCNVAMNPELSSKITLSDHQTVTVFVKRFHSKNTLCSSPRLHCN
jgi:hypothetical protein